MDPIPDEHYLSTAHADLRGKKRARSEEREASKRCGGKSSAKRSRRRGSFDSSPSPVHPPTPLGEIETFLSCHRFALPRQSDRPDTSSLAAHDYDVDVRSGFLPPEPPLRRLPRELGFEVWEERLDEARKIYVELGPKKDEGRDGGEQEAEGSEADFVDAWDKRWEAWKEGVRHMNHPSLDSLITIPLLRRAHLVLSFLSHFYVHCSLLDTSSSSGGEEIVPEIPTSLASPWMEVSDRLDIPPILTYADTVLWNWGFKDPSKGFDKDNVEILTTFTSSLSEQHFFLTSLLIEYHGVPALRLMSLCLDEAFLSDETSFERIASYLEQLAVVIRDITSLLEDVRKGCDPRTYYWEERIWYNGGKWRYGPAGDGKGFERVLKYGGPSAGQSSLIHALDLFLGIEHTPMASPPPSNSTPGEDANKDSNPSSKMSEHDTTFMQRMQLYMPHHHRRFLSHLASLSSSFPATSPTTAMTAMPKAPPIRSLALSSPPSSPLRRAYDVAVNSMKLFRDAHVRIVYLYIIQQSRGSPPRGGLGWRMEERRKRMSEAPEATPPAVVEGKGGGDKVAPKGTGGTDLVRFLKACRDRTVEAVVGDLKQVRSGKRSRHGG